MWIASKLGFYSIVRKAGGWHVRARVRGDLVNLAAVAGLDPETIEEWPAADYRWRIRVKKRFLSRVFRVLEASIDYPNFKSEIAATPEQRPKLHTYHNLWTNLYRVQEEGLQEQ